MATYKIKRIIRQCQERHPDIDKDIVRAIWLDGYSIATIDKDKLDVVNVNKIETSKE